MKSIADKILLLFGLLTCFSQLQSQVIREDTTQAIKVFEGEQETLRVDTTPTLQSVIHFGWLHPIRGRFPFFYEQALGGYFAGSIGLGFTYADFFRAEHASILFDDTEGQMNFGVHSEALTKFYPGGLAAEEFYFALNFKFSTFNFEKNETNFLNDIQERHYEYLLLAGIQFGNWNDVIVADYYMGVGLSDVYTREDNLINVGGSFSTTPSTTRRGFRPILRVGVKMGIRLK